MEKSILDNKRLLIVDDEPDILAVVKAEIRDACPESTIDTATTYEQALKLLKTNKYDIVILDIMGVRGFDLLEEAIERKFKVAMLTAHALSPEALKKSHDMGAMAYLPKDKLGELVPFLEDVLRYDYKTGWQRLMNKLDNYFTEQFEHDWKSNLWY
ncbi:MAG TPA: response regulator [Syntrophorhabdaceae bacterium]|nr:response regulator [Syntrophorhabdaceae bacterium]